MAKRYTSDPEAFDLYARRRYFWNKRNVSTGILTPFRSNRRPRLVCRSGSVARRRPRAPESNLRRRDADGSIDGVGHDFSRVESATSRP